MSELGASEGGRTWLQSIKHWLGIGAASAAGASESMWRLYRTNLEVRVATINSESLTKVEQSIYADTQSKLQALTLSPDSEIAWDGAYQIERMIGYLLEGNLLKDEIRARLREMTSEKFLVVEQLKLEFDEIAKRPQDGSEEKDAAMKEFLWPAPGSEDTELGVLMEPEVGHGETEVYARVQA